MRIVFNKINKEIFEALRDGTKKVETRAGTPKYRKIKEGQTVSFSCDGEIFEKIVRKVSFVDSIKELLTLYVPQDIHPNLTTEEEIVSMYHSFPGYEEKIKKSGLVAMEFAN